jgi:hypothetical protein
MNGAKALRQRASFSSRVMRREIMYATIDVKFQEVVHSI